MSADTVQEILDRIRQLPEEDRLLLDQRLAELFEVDWRREAGEARNRSRILRVNQSDIDRAIEDIRHSE